MLRTIVPNQIMKYHGLHSTHLFPFDLNYVRFINTSNDPFILADSIDIVLTNVDVDGVIYGEKHSNWQSINCTAETADYPLTDGKEILDNY
jgi:hypothetical protein